MFERTRQSAWFDAVTTSVAYQINETGKMKQDEQERVRPKRARDTRVLSPLHRRQLKCP